MQNFPYPNFFLSFSQDDVIENGVHPFNGNYIYDQCDYTVTGNVIDFDSCTFFGNSSFGYQINNNVLFINGGIEVDGPGYYFNLLQPINSSPTVSIVQNGIYGISSVTSSGNIVFFANSFVNAVDTIIYEICSPIGICDQALLILNLINEDCIPILNLSGNIVSNYYYADDIIICDESVSSQNAGAVFFYAGSEDNGNEYIELSVGFNCDRLVVFNALNFGCDLTD